MIHAECQQTRELLDSYLSAELLVETNHQILRHLSACAACRLELSRRQRVRALLKAALPVEDPPPDLQRRIAGLPLQPGAGGGVPVRARVRALWGRLGRARGASHSRRQQLAGRWIRQGLAGAGVAALLALLFIVIPGTPWRPARLTASELLARSDEAVRAVAARSDVVLHRSLSLEERRGRSGPVLARRRIEIWQSAGTGIELRRAFDERNALVAGEWRQRDGTQTVYRAGAPPQRSPRPVEPARLGGLDTLDHNAAWRLDLSATQYASLIPAASAARVSDVPGHFVLTYQAPPAGAESAIVEATLKLTRDTLHPVEQTVVVDRGGEVREYALSEQRFDAVPREQVAHSIFEPDQVLVGRSDAPASRPSGSAAPPSPAAPPVVPSLEAELDVVYRLHRVDAWLRDSPSVSRTAEGGLRVAVVVSTEARQRHLEAVLRSVAAPGVAIDIAADAADPALPAGPRSPPADLRSMAMYDRLRAGFTEYIESRVPAAERPAADERDRLIDGLVRSLAARNLDRAHGALGRAVVLEQTLKRFSPSGVGRLSPDGEATLQTMLRDHARGIEHRLEAMRLELQPMLGPSWPIDAAPAPPPAATVNLTRTAEQLTRLLIEIDNAITLAFGPAAASRSAPAFSDAASWERILEAERLAAAFQQPLPLGAR